MEAFVGGLDADTWEFKFGQDMRRLAIEIMIHVCGDSCFKYSDSNTTQICRHGFYYVVVLEDWRRRRRGKYIRNAGMYLALGALRCNLLPHISDRPDYGYMNKYEWDGGNWLSRREEVAGELAQKPLRWTSDGCVEDWRTALLHCLKGCPDSPATGESGDDALPSVRRWRC